MYLFKVTSAFGVFRECFVLRFTVTQSKSIGTWLSVELNGPKNTSKMIPMIPRSQTSPTWLQGRNGRVIQEQGRILEGTKPGVISGRTDYYV